MLRLMGMPLIPLYTKRNYGSPLASKSMESTSLYIRIFALHWGLSGGLTFIYFRAIVKLIHKSHWLAISIFMDLHIDIKGIWPPFGWWHFQSHFLAWELLYFNQISPNHSQAECLNNNKLLSKPMIVHLTDGHVCHLTQITKFMGPTCGPPGSCRPQMGPMLAPWTLLSGLPRFWSMHE